MRVAPRVAPADPLARTIRARPSPPSAQVSAADINSIAAEAGLLAVRANRYVVLPKDFQAAYRKATKKQDTEHSFYSS